MDTWNFVAITVDSIENKLTFFVNEAYGLAEATAPQPVMNKVEKI